MRDPSEAIRDPARVRSRSGSLWRRLRGEGVGAVLARGAAAAATAKAAAAAGILLAQILMARALGVSAYGVVVYALAWVNVVVLLAKLGIDTTLVRMIARYRSQVAWGALHGLIKWALALGLLGGAGVALLGWPVVEGLAERLPGARVEPFRWALVLVPVMTLTVLVQATLRGLRHAGTCELPLPIITILAGAAIGAWAWVQQAQVSAAGAMGVLVVSGMLVLAGAGFWLYTRLPADARAAAPRYYPREWLLLALPFLFNEGMRLILSQTDIIMLGSMASPEAAGIYAAASRLGAVAAFGLIAINTIAAPLISELYASERREALQRLVVLAARGSTALALAAAVALIAGGRLVLGWFGEEFPAGYGALLILLAGQVVNALTGSVGYLMTMTGHERQAAKILFLSACANVALNALLIPRYGLLGAAAATAASTIMWNVLMLVYVRRIMQIRVTALEI